MADMEGQRRGRPTQARGRVLVVEDEAPLQIALRRVLLGNGLEVHCASNGKEALEALGRHGPFDLALIDLCMPVMGGMAFLRELRRLEPHTEALIMTANGTVETALEAMKLGARDYLLKPFGDIFQVCSGPVLEAVAESQARRARFAAPEGESSRWPGLLGESAAMRALFAQMASVEGSQAPVLLEGESGVGKWSAARALYGAQEAPLACLDCASLPEGELEALLFGGARPAVIGGLRAPREGLVEARAPLYLGEVGELSPRLQARLAQAWRAQQQGQRAPRWFASSSCSLGRAVQEGRLREDLYYLLAVVRLRVPALRERKGDIALLSEAFLGRARRRRPEAPARLHAETLEVLEQAPWYGNVRELENAIERAALFAREPALLPRDLPDYLTRPTSEALSGFAPELAELDYVEAKQRIVADFEQRYLVEILERSSGNISQAAKVAGMDRSNFRRLLKRHHFHASGEA